MSEIVYKEESYQIVGACYEVYRHMGCGFLESVYQECLEAELRQRGIPYAAKPRLTLAYKRQPLKCIFEPDLVCFGKIIVELKAVAHLSDEHKAQVMNYLKATDFALAMLVNFGHFPGAEIERLANTARQKIAVGSHPIPHQDSMPL